jgi:hypothetical protein
VRQQRSDDVKFRSLCAVPFKLDERFIAAVEQKLAMAVTSVTACTP